MSANSSNAATVPTIKLELDQNPFLRATDLRTKAALWVTPEGFDEAVATAAPSQRAVALVIDKSGSMEGNKIKQAREAACVAVDQLDENTIFQIITFSSSAQCIFPTSGAATATDANKKAAKVAISAIGADGGTEMSKGLRKALDGFLKTSLPESMVIFLTDGANNDDDETPLQSVLKEIQAKRAEGKNLRVLTRGIGTDFQVTQLQEIADATLGGPPQVVANPADLIADFKGAVQLAQSNVVTNVRLKVWVPAIVKLEEVRQISPSMIDMTANAIASSTEQNMWYFPLGGWNKEPRQLYLALTRTKAELCGQRRVFAKAWITWDYNGTQYCVGAGGDQAIDIVGEWTDEAAKSAVIPQGVAIATGTVKIAAAIQEGTDALLKGDQHTAVIKLGEAAKIAHETGDSETINRINEIVDVQNASTGTVKVKATGVDKGATMKVQASGTVRVAAKPIA